MSRKNEEIEVVEITPLHHGEEILTALENGYLFHAGDGNVKYRSTDEHNQVVKSREFVEPAPRKPQTIGQTLGHEPA